MTPETNPAVARLLERLLTDPSFRRGFRRDPAAACRAAGLDRLADEVRHQEKALQTLELRESKSSLAGVLMAAAAEVVGVVELAAWASEDGPPDQPAAGVVREVLSQPRMKAITGPLPPLDVPSPPSGPQDTAEAVEPGAPPAAAPVNEPAPPAASTDEGDEPPVLENEQGLRGCAECGSRLVLMEPEVSVCSGCGLLGGKLAAAREQAPAPWPVGQPPGGALEARRMPAIGAVDRPGADEPALIGAVEWHGRGGQDRVEALADGVGAPAPAAATPVAPVDPTYTTGSNAGGALHGSEFLRGDGPEGIPFSDGSHKHGGYDLFAQPGAPVRSPVPGTIVDVDYDNRTSGQVFGGTVKIQGADGKVWVFRHVDPAGLSVGQRVAAGERVANVTDWAGGGSHVHIERWLTYRPDGYRGDNVVDPLPELQAAYGQPTPGVPPDGLEPGQAPTVPPPGQAPTVPAPDAPISRGRASGVFQAVREHEAQPPPRFQTVRIMRALPDPLPQQDRGLTPPAPGEVVPLAEFDPSDITPHPGPTATQAQVAQWMAANAVRVGLPPELPVMAALVESELRYGLTPDVSDLDSAGYFQMRMSVWNRPPWTNYANEPEKQLHWFLSQAAKLKEHRIAAGYTSFGQDPDGYGEWCADVENPAAQYRYKYATRRDEARGLLA